MGKKLLSHVGVVLLAHLECVILSTLDSMYSLDNIAGYTIMMVLARWIRESA